MNFSYWLNHFKRNRRLRTEPRWDMPVTMEPRTIAALLPSLEQFQLGDGGGPACLIARDAARFHEATEEIHQLVDLWFTEEREHSRLLSCAVRRFGGRLRTSHWSFTAFCMCRRILGVRIELQVLLLTELVSTAYYRVMRRHAQDEPLQDMCSLILRDEAGHVHFHRARLASGRRPSNLPHPLWVIQFWICGHAAASMLWLNHGPSLRALGATSLEYFQEVRFELSRFVRRLSASVSRRRSTSTTPDLPSAAAA
jgi:hypothetical protein